MPPVLPSIWHTNTTTNHPPPPQPQVGDEITVRLVVRRVAGRRVTFDTQALLQSGEAAVDGSALALLPVVHADKPHTPR